MDDTTTTVIVEDEAPAEDETINLDAEVTVTFTVTRTYRVDNVPARQIIADIAKASADQGGHRINEPDPAWVDDASEYAYALLDDNPMLRDLVLDEWSKTADIEDEEFTVEEVV